MVVSSPGRQCDHQTCLCLERGTPSAGSIGGLREVVNARRSEPAVTIVEPDLKPLAREDLLNHQVGNAITIHILGGERNGGFIGREGQFAILTGRDMEPDSKQRSSLKFSGIEQHRSVGTFVVIKVGSNEPRAPRAVEKDLRSWPLRQGSAQPRLRPQ